jgi:hypothetical protein
MLKSNGAIVQSNGYELRFARSVTGGTLLAFGTLQCGHCHHKELIKERFLEFRDEGDDTGESIYPKWMKWRKRLEESRLCKKCGVLNVPTDVKEYLEDVIDFSHIGPEDLKGFVE